MTHDNVSLITIAIRFTYFIKSVFRIPFSVPDPFRSAKPERDLALKKKKPSFPSVDELSSKRR